MKTPFSSKVREDLIAFIHAHAKYSGTDNRQLDDNFDRIGDRLEAMFYSMIDSDLLNSAREDIKGSKELNYLFHALDLEFINSLQLANPDQYEPLLEYNGLSTFIYDHVQRMEVVLYLFANFANQDFYIRTILVSYLKLLNDNGWFACKPKEELLKHISARKLREFKTQLEALDKHRVAIREYYDFFITPNSIKLSSIYPTPQVEYLLFDRILAGIENEKARLKEDRDR
jgi:hypothetical protein